MNAIVVGIIPVAGIHQLEEFVHHLEVGDLQRLVDTNPYGNGST